MNPQLVGPASLGKELDKGNSPTRLQNFIPTDRRTALSCVDGHFLPVLWMPTYRKSNLPLTLWQASDHDSSIGFAHLSRFKLFSEGFQRRLILGDEQDAGRILIKSMDDPRTERCFFNIPSPVCQQGVHHRPMPLTGGGMYNHTGRFVNRGQTVIFIQDIERNIFRRSGGWLGKRGRDFYDFTAADRIARLLRISVYQNMATSNEQLCLGPTDFRERGNHQV